MDRAEDNPSASRDDRQARWFQADAWSGGGGFSRSLRTLLTLALIVLLLYFGSEVLIPLALAILITFILTPLVAKARRLGLPRIPAACLVATLAFASVGALAYEVVEQLIGVATSSKLESYVSNFEQRMASLRRGGPDGKMERMSRFWRRMVSTLRGVAGDGIGGSQPQPDAGRLAHEPGAMKDVKPGAKEPVEVVVKDDDTFLSRWPPALGLIATQLVRAAFVVALVFFLLMNREDLRDRTLRLIGLPSLPLATKALDEADTRISSYLLRQCASNATFGLASGVCFWLIGFPDALLFGALGALLRFIPYLGTWIAISLPFLVSLGALPGSGWTGPLLVLCLPAGIELALSMLVEPLWLGSSAGISSVAQLVAMAFWTLVWGPVGLLLAIPLTVCVLVIAKHFPDLRFLVVLLSERLDVDPREVFHHRLLASDTTGLPDVVKGYLSTHPAEQIYDDVLVPALGHVKHSAIAGSLTSEDRRKIHDVVRGLLEKLPLANAAETIAVARRDMEPPRLTICGFPAQDDADELLLAMLAQLTARDADLDVLSTHLLASEALAHVAAQRPRLVCIAALAPGGNSQARHLAKRMRQSYRDQRIVIVRAGPASDEAECENLLEATGIDEVTRSLMQTHDLIRQLRSLADAEHLRV